jgi:hypothetical protein
MATNPKAASRTPEWTKIYDGTESSDASSEDTSTSTSTDRAGFVAVSASSAALASGDGTDESDSTDTPIASKHHKTHRHVDVMTFPGLKPEKQFQWEQVTIVSDAPPIGTGSQADIFVGYIDCTYLHPAS